MIDYRRENDVLRQECNSLSTRCDAVEMGMLEYKALYEMERAKSSRK
jgi:hypothetical protein